MFFAVLPIAGAHAADEESITLAMAVERAVAADPRLCVIETQIEAAAGQVDQAGVRPNPVLGAELENFVGTGDFQAFDAAELTLGLRQLIETAAKREKRTAVARSERREVAWEAEMRLYELRAAVRAAFAEVLLGQQLIELNEDFLELAGRGEEETRRLVEAARAPEVDLTRSQLSVRRREFALEQARRALEAARSRLSILWGETNAGPFTARGEVALEETLPTFDALAAILPKTALVARFDAVEETRRRALELEEARARPDFEIFAGGRYEREPGHAAFVAGIDIPWPVFDRNQGNIRTAQARLRAVNHERAAAQRELFMRLSDAYQRLAAAHEEVRSVEENLQPAAEETLERTEELYEGGQYTLLNVIESRQTLFEIRQMRLDALRRYAQAAAEIAALTQAAQSPTE